MLILDGFRAVFLLSAIAVSGPSDIPASIDEPPNVAQSQGVMACPATYSMSSLSPPMAGGGGEKRKCFDMGKRCKTGGECCSGVCDFSERGPLRLMCH